MTKKSQKAPNETRRGKPAGAAQRPARAARGRKAAPAVNADKAGAPKPGGRTGTKQAELIAMLRRTEGLTIEETAAAFAWQPHTVRGCLYGALKKLGFDVTSEKVEGRGRVYRIAN